jgi:hypothetical protein
LHVELVIASWFTVTDMQLNFSSFILLLGSLGFLAVGLHFENLMIILLAGLLLGYAMIVHGYNLVLLREEKRQELGCSLRPNRRYVTRFHR